METEQVARNLTLDQTLPGRAVFASRLLLYSVIALFLSAVGWLALTKVDVVVQARGQLTVQGEPIRISLPEAGIAAEVPVGVGDHVMAGQLVLRLDSYRYDAAEARLKAEIDQAQAEVARYMSLSAQVRGGDDSAQTEGQAVVAQAAVHSLQVQLADARQSRRRLSLTAPRAGTITRLAAQNIGAAVAADTPAIVLLPDNLPLLAQVRIPNASMRRLRVGDAARVSLDAFPREDFGEIPGRLVSIEPDADDQGFYKAWIDIQRAPLEAAAGQRLVPGLQLDARIIIEHRSLLSLLLNPLRKLTQSMTVSQ